MDRPVHTAECPSRAPGAPTGLSPCQTFVAGSYRPPVLSAPIDPAPWPPQTIMRVPVQIAVCPARAMGTPALVMRAQVSVIGLYRPPVYSTVAAPSPPQTIMREPVQTAVCPARRAGAPAVATGAQESVVGL